METMVWAKQRSDMSGLKRSLRLPAGEQHDTTRGKETSAEAAAKGQAGCGGGAAGVGMMVTGRTGSIWDMFWSCGQQNLWRH